MTTIETIRNETDLKALTHMLGHLWTQECWKAFEGVGLMLYFGNRIPFTSKKVQGYKGEYILQVLGAEWKIQNQQQRPLEPESLQGASVSNVKLLPDASFVVTFNNGATLTVSPSEKDKESGVPYWQFSCPTAFLVAGPGVRWSILSPDERY